MKFNEWIEEESQHRHHADAREETEQDEKTSHPAEERFAAHVTPTFGGPFFVVGPPGGFRTGVVGVGHWFIVVLRTAYYVLHIA